eukprot:403360607
MSKAAGNGNTETVKVMVRVRPMNTKEKQKGCKSCVQVDTQQNQVYISKPDETSNQKAFAFDSVYDIDSKQQSVYDEGAFPLVESVIEGYNGTIFAYGQTGCGKTHTMLGYPETPELRGIIPNCFNHIFGFIDANKDGTKFLVRCSYLEIYNEEIRDLLVDNRKGVEPQKLELKEDPNKGLFVKDLNCLIVKSIPEIEKAMNFGTNNRKVASTNMNETSSRSHSIFTIYIETGTQINGEQRIKAGKLNLVDLAGSERQSKTGAQGSTLKEGIKINLSLTALGNVIGALVDGKSAHIPYRDSKLTRMLQDSLGGNTKTVMIAAVSPADYNYEETLSTLRYASRAKAIKNKPKVNEDPKDALLKEYELEIKKLRDMLQSLNSGGQVNVAQEIRSFKQHISDDHITMDLKELQNTQSDWGQGNGNQMASKEETIEDLIAKLEQKGKKVVIHDENDQQIQETPSFNGKVDIKRMKNESETSLTKKDEENNQSLIQDELRKKEQDLESERQEKEQLGRLIQELEKKLVVGGQTLEEKEREQIQKQREAQLQLRQQKKKQKQLLEEKRKKEEEMLLVEKNYKNLQEEVEDMREIIKKLREKYKQSQQEIEDLHHESQYNKEDLLETIRSQDKDVKFANKVMAILLSENEMYKVKQRAQWDENRSDWKIPLFTFNAAQKDIQFPNINAQSRVNQMKDERDLQFDDDPNALIITGSKMTLKKTQQSNAPKIVGQSGLDQYQASQVNGAHLVRSVEGSDNDSIDNDNTSSGLQQLNKKQKPFQSQVNQQKQGPKSSNYNISNEVPDRRRKYLNNITANDDQEDDEQNQQQQKKRLNVHLQPIQPQSMQNRNLSMPHQNQLQLNENSAATQHLLNFAPTQKTKPKLEQIDHGNFKVNPNSMLNMENNGYNNLIANLPSPNQGGAQKKKLDPIYKQ